VVLRGFKLELEDQCEDYGQVAIYRGSIEGQPNQFTLDDHHVFESGMPMRVCKNTADMLGGSRYAPHFAISAEMFHMGLFDCASPGAASDSSSESPASSADRSCC
jgi:hypothetical protein